MSNGANKRRSDDSLNTLPSTSKSTLTNIKTSEQYNVEVMNKRRSIASEQQTEEELNNKLKDFKSNIASISEQSDCNNKLSDQSGNVSDSSEDYTPHPLSAYGSYDYDSYERSTSSVFGRPLSKYHGYSLFTKNLGFVYCDDNKFLLKDGIFDINVLPFTQPFYCFWRDGLDVYFPVQMEFNTDIRKLVFKRSTCIKHAHRHYCPKITSPSIEDSDVCEIERLTATGGEITFLLHGTLQFRKIKFPYYYVDVINSRVENKSKSLVIPEVTIKLKDGVDRIKVYLIKECTHTDCAATKTFIPFSDMKSPVRNICSKIELSPEGLKDEYINKECFFYGKGLQGVRRLSCFYLCTWDPICLYIIC